MSTEIPQIVIVDDEAEALLSLIRALKATGLVAAIHGASRVEQARELFKQHHPQAAVLDLCLDERRGVESGFALLQEVVALDPTCRIIVLTGHGTVDYGVRALNSGAASFIEKPAEVAHLAALLRDALSQSALKREYRRMTESHGDEVADLIVGSSSRIREVHDAVRYAAHTDQAVLIVGETGTGKGLCAQAIHRLSARRDERFVRYQPNFATADLVNSDLFGHSRGAFTGATEDRRGLISEADRGTLFLDEIEELPLETQVALLGVLQERRFRPVGSSKESQVDFRLICASNSDVEADIAAGKLRRDFFHRVAHFRIVLPPLSERRDDIEALALHALRQLRERGRVNVFSIEGGALAALHSYAWPGNIRELEAVVEGAAYRAQFRGRVDIGADDITFSTGARSTVSSAQDFHTQVEAFKIRLIREALDRHGGNQVRAANELALDRSTMRRILGRTQG